MTTPIRCNPDHNKFSSLSNTTVVAIFPKLCLWRRSLCSNLGGIGLEKLYRATLSPEIPKISVRSNLNIWDHLWRRSTLRQAWSFLSIVPKWPFPYDKIVVRSTAPLSPADNYNNQTRGWLGSGLRNRNVLFHQAREMSEFSQVEFLLNGKCPWN